MILPTRRALLALALAAPVAMLGLISPLALDALLAIDAGLILAVLVDAWLAVDPRRLEITRDAPDSFSAGRPVRFHYRWENPSSLSARLRVREVRPRLLGGALAPRDIRIPARGTLREERTAQPMRRGKESAGWLALRSRGPLGLGQRQRRRDMPWTVTVYPNLPASRLKASIAAAAERLESGLRPQRRLGAGRQFESLREWVPGDEPRHIDWKATARHNKLITREYEEERRQQVLLLLDTGRLMSAEIAGESRLEHVVRAALWLAFAANRYDDDIGIMAFSDDIQHYAAPARGRRGLRTALDVLAVLEPGLVEPDYPAAFRYLAVRNRKRTLTVLFTDVIDRLASEAIVANVGSLQPRHLPVVVTLRNPQLDAVAEQRPRGVTDAYRKAAAEELLDARRRALTAMRRRGALVVDAHPERAAESVVAKYTELKRRGRL